MKVTVLGCGTSTGVPAIGCDCRVCTSDDPRNQRSRCSAYLAKGDARLLIDCGPDFRMQALRENISQVDGLFVTHTHADHIFGMDDLRAVNWRQGRPVQVFGDQATLDKLSVVFDYCFNPPQQGGGVPQFQFQLVENGVPFDFEGVRVTPVPILHGKLPILGYRFDDLVYLTDCSAIPESSYPLIEGVDTLIISALREKPHSTHFSIHQAIEEAKRFSPRQTFFIHMTHDLDYSETNKDLPEGMELLYDGMEFETVDSLES